MSHNYPEPPFPKQPQDWPGFEADMTPNPQSSLSTYKSAGKLDGKVALITGGDSGIGRAIAIAYAAEGADVVISYLNEHEDADFTQKLVKEFGKECVLIAGDIQDKNHCKKLIDSTLEKFGKIDILVNNAAYQMTFDDLTKFTTEELDKTFHTNIYAMIYLMQFAVPNMKQGSSIINTASIQAYTPSPNLMPYAATKAAIVNITKSTAEELVTKGIRVNAVAPGPVWTPLIPSTMSSAKVQDFGKTSWFNRPAQPAELAPIFVFLASEDASYVTGQVYGATGQGWP